jgi:hypothetical protein
VRLAMAANVAVIRTLSAQIDNSADAGSPISRPV